MNYPET